MKVLVAGIGNVFLGDDGFGVEVVRRRLEQPWPPEVEVVDYGIRGVHLAYDLLDTPYDVLVLVDAVPLTEQPGTVALLDATDHATDRWEEMSGATVEAHSMSPDAVLRTLHALGGHVDRVLVVGCRPAVLDEGMGLSEPVDAAVGEAARLVARTLRELTETSREGVMR